MFYSFPIDLSAIIIARVCAYNDHYSTEGKDNENRRPTLSKGCINVVFQECILELFYDSCHFHLSTFGGSTKFCRIVGKLKVESDADIFWPIYGEFEFDEAKVIFYLL